ncbi:glycosyl hydrolase [Paenibacillus sanguinis]|uniref:glycosyl hydrolase n=1 Tax=Paenibacillus sanguinis TaxID=225906 RepID=UPI000A018453|nr:glycosyl hydrolase [Paenibacillus sanguinis]
MRRKIGKTCRLLSAVVLAVTLAMPGYAVHAANPQTKEVVSDNLKAQSFSGKLTAPKAQDVDLADADATAETRSLFAFLNETRGKAVLFGHQHDTTVSFAGKDAQGRVISDVKNSVGDYPAVFGWDTLSLDGLEAPPGVAGDYEASRIGLSSAMKQAYEMGGIVTLSTHPYNFATGGSFNDTGNSEGAVKSVAARVLPGGDLNSDFQKYLNRIASFANQLKDDQGKLIPVLFRPFHEQNGNWFWWGSATTTTSEYKELYRYTVEYLRDVKHVHNLLYVFSPNGSFNGNEEEYLKTYPGDSYVDILGMDQYDNKENAGSEAFLAGLVKDLKMISGLADSKGKIAALSEYGYSAAGMKTTGNHEKEWFTKVMNAIKSDPDARKIAYMLTWANFGEDNNLYVPYKEVPGKGSHELLNDFINYYKDPYTAFAGDLQREQVYGRKVNTRPKQPFLHIVTPVHATAVSEAATTVRAKVLNLVPDKVVYRIGQAGQEIQMSLGPDGYYAASWTPPVELNGTTVELTVRAYHGGKAALEQTVAATLKVPELKLKSWTFDTAESLAWFKNNGTYPADIQMKLAHKYVNDNGKLAFQIDKGLKASQTWQELKLQLTEKALADVDLSRVRRIKLSALIPAAMAKDAATIQAVAMYPEDWSHKYGEGSTRQRLSELTKVTVSGASYYQYKTSIELDQAASAASAEGLAISLVGSGLEANAPISLYLDDLELYDVYMAPVLEASWVDDFETYDGSDEALSAKYPKAGGDDVRVSLSGEEKFNGQYSMKYQYAVNTAGYTGAGKNLNSVDWSESNGLHIWIKTDETGAYAGQGKPLKLVIQVLISGTAYEYYPNIEPAQAYDLTIPFDEFVVAPWSSGGPITKEGLKQVTGFNLYVNSMDQGDHQGVLYFDDIQAVHDAHLPDIPTK